MKIEQRNITVRELTKGYKDNQEAGVVGYSGNLDIRPPYQREFVYKDAQRVAVIETVIKNFPLNILYWADRENGTYEVMDGQQRTISIAEYVSGVYSVNEKYFHNLTIEEQKEILNYVLTVYVCTGSEKEKLEWFKVINIAGEKLTTQELRNAVYAGTWLSAAKKLFSKPNCPAYQLGNKYVKGSPIRQDILETTLKWISAKNGISIEEYMAKNQHENDATEIWLYYQQVIAWVKATFPTVRKEMNNIDWGILHNNYSYKKFDSLMLEEKIIQLMADEDVTSKPGIYSYLITGDEKFLSVRAFSDNQKTEAYIRQNRVCVKCNKTFAQKEMQADHITPWSKGGKTISENCQMLCADCNRRKSNS